MGVGKKKKPDFGTRGRKQVEPTERKATVVQRLTKMGTGWWAASGLQTKKPPHAKGFKRHARDARGGKEAGRYAERILQGARAYEEQTVQRRPNRPRASSGPVKNTRTRQT